MTKTLPLRPHLGPLRKQARQLLSELKQGVPSAMDRALRHHPQGIPLPKAQLADAQLIIAREYGFNSWPRLKSRVIHLSIPKNLGDALQALRHGRPCILFDDEGRENEGDIVFAAEKVSAEAINFITRHGRGTLCLALTQEIAHRLGLKLVNPERRNLTEPAFMHSIDAMDGITTGVSASDRAETICRAVAQDSGPGTIRSPGHVFPLLGHPDGIRGRQGHTEGALELMEMAGLIPAAVICEILQEDGSMARMPELEQVASLHSIPLVRISDILGVRAVAQ